MYLEEGEPGRVDHYWRVRVRERQGGGGIKEVKGKKETESGVKETESDAHVQGQQCARR